jgi:PAS domain S-box-containing protein
MVKMVGVGQVDEPVDDAGPNVDLLASVVEHSPLGMSLTPVDPSHASQLDLRSVLVNTALADMLGYTRQELRALVFQPALTHPDDRAVDRAQVQRLLAGPENAVQWEKRYLHRDGHTIWARVSASLLRGPDGTPRFVVAQIEDITARREAEAALASAQEAALEQERAIAEQLRQALASRIVVEQAKGMLAATYGTSVEEAFQRLRRYARQHNAKIHDVATAVVNLGLRP